MNLGFFFIFIIIQMIINYGCQTIIFSLVGEVTIWALLGSSLISSLIISIIWGILATPPGYRKEFYKQPGFHKTTLSIFLVFAIIDVIWLFI